LKNLDAGVVGNARRLIVRGFAGYVVPTPWPDQEEKIDMDFLISRCGALNPLHCDYGWESDDDGDAGAIAVAEATVAGDI
jgi:hypothetical protein